MYQALKREYRKHRMPIVDLVKVRTRDPFKVLVSTILSARTRDETTAAATQRLLAVVDEPDDLRGMTVDAIDRLIFPVGFHSQKARYLRELPERMRDLFGGRLPDSVEDLIQLPGVGRKTANLVVAVGFGKPAICVDVHVHRICNRLGYVKTRTPFETEMRLRSILPLRYWTTINAYLVSFGQHTCRPLNPRCNRCPVFDECARAGVRTKFAREG